MSEQQEAIQMATEEVIGGEVQVDETMAASLDDSGARTMDTVMVVDDQSHEYNQQNPTVISAFGVAFSEDDVSETLKRIDLNKRHDLKSVSRRTLRLKLSKGEVVDMIASTVTGNTPLKEDSSCTFSAASTSSSSKPVAASASTSSKSPAASEEASTSAATSSIISPSKIYQPPAVLCGDNKSGCSLPGISVFPCIRCHREFYCSEEHRVGNRIRHEPDCHTKSNLLVHSMDKEYQMWLNHAAPTCYDVYLNFLMVWSSLTVQWLPTFQESDAGEEHYELLAGTHTSGNEMNHLLVCGVKIPNINPDELDDDSNVTSFVRYEGSLFVKKRINHEGEIHRARHLPQSSNIIATKSPAADVYIFDLDKYPELPTSNEFQPRLRLKGHSKEGFGLAWNPVDPGFLLSGSNDYVVCLWDINHLDKDATFLNPVTTFKHHTGVVEDVDWHSENSCVAVSVGDDKKIVLWDTRGASGTGDCWIYSKEDAHSSEINSVKFSPFNEYAFITGSSDRTVALWDMRQFNQKLHSFEQHRDEVMQLQWSPHNESLFASTGKDKRVFVWNLKNINKCESELTNRQMPAPSDDSDEVPTELQFIHGGHIGPINDISWNPHDVGMIASVCEENTLQVWKISEDILFGNESSDFEDELSSKS